MKHRCRLSLLAIPILLVAGCLPHTDAMRFRSDDRVRFVAPEGRATLGEPVTLKWQAKDVGPESFGLFVDVPPARPGRSLVSAVISDRTCASLPGCPGAEYLAAHNVFAADGLSMILPRLKDSDVRYSGRNLHTVILVLLDQQGHRVGESSWRLQFWTRTGGHS